MFQVGAKCLAKTKKFQGLVVHSYVNAWLKFKPLFFSFCISTPLFISKLQKPKLLLIQTRILKKYFQAYEQDAREFLLYHTLIQG